MALAKRGGRKLVVSPDIALPSVPVRPRVDNAMVKAIARAFRWRKLLDASAYANIEELAASEKINPSYVSRVLRLTLLAPDIVEAILDGRQSVELTLAALMKPFPMVWVAQVGRIPGAHKFESGQDTICNSAERAREGA